MENMIILANHFVAIKCVMCTLLLHPCVCVCVCVCIVIVSGVCCVNMFYGIWNIVNLFYTFLNYNFHQPTD